MNKINLHEASKAIEGYWNPLLLNELNGQSIKLAKFKGEFDWHHHKNEDEAFIVISGSIQIEFRDTTMELKTGELIVIPRGIEHKPTAEQEAIVMLFEPSSTLNTGNVITDKTRTSLKEFTETNKRSPKEL